MMPRPMLQCMLLLTLPSELFGSDRPHGAVFDDLQLVRFPAVASVVDVT